jgi:vitamin B12 transporter
MLFGRGFSKSLGITVAAIITAGGSTSAVQAQQELPGIVVSSATRTAIDINKVGSTVEVIDRAELEKHGQTHLKDYLERLPGVSFAQSGPPGSATTIRVRGAAGQYVKVLIDGMDITDLAAPQAAPSLEHLLVDDIERIELLMGPQSTLYGSEAVAGVVSITTRRAARGLSVRAHAEGGTYRTRSGGTTVAYGGQRGAVTFSAQGISTDGFSAAEENTGNTERDGYRNVTLSGSGHYELSDTLKVFFAARSTNAKIELDSFSFAPPFLPIDALGERSTFALRAARSGAEWSLFDGRLVNTFAVQRVTIERENFGSFPALYESDRTKYEYKGVARFSSVVSMVVGADHDRTAVDTSLLADTARATTTGLFGQFLIEPIKNLNFTAGARRDDHSIFGSYDTFRLTAAYYMPQTGTKFRASYGTAFRSPSLFELFDPSFGNVGLAPEESVGWDAGVDQTFSNGDYKFSFTYFSLDIDNLIQFTFPAGYANLPGQSERRGFVISSQAKLAPWLSASASYTRTDAEDENGNRLVRVPRHMVTLGVDVKPIERLTLTTTAQIVRDTIDSNNFVLDDYVLLNARLAYDVSERLTLFVRGTNLLNQEYQTVRGYGTSDLAVYAGLQMKLQTPDAFGSSMKLE